MAAPPKIQRPAVTDTPRGYVMIPIGGTEYRFRLTAGALKEVKAARGQSIITMFRTGAIDEDDICAILDAGFHAGWRDGDPDLPDTSDVEIGDILRAAEYIAAGIGEFFGVDIPLLRTAVGKWLHDLLAETVDGITSPTGTNSPVTEHSLTPEE